MQERPPNGYSGISVFNAVTEDLACTNISIILHVHFYYLTANALDYSATECPRARLLTFVIIRVQLACAAGMRSPDHGIVA